MRSLLSEASARQCSCQLPARTWRYEMVTLALPCSATTVQRNCFLLLLIGRCWVSSCSGNVATPKLLEYHERCVHSSARWPGCLLIFLRICLATSSCLALGALSEQTTPRTHAPKQAALPSNMAKRLLRCDCKNVEKQLVRSRYAFGRAQCSCGFAFEGARLTHSMRRCTPILQKPSGKHRKTLVRRRQTRRKHVRR